MERKIGEIFTYNGKTYQVIETNACRDCAFKVRLCEALESITGTCIPGERTDHTSVSFKLINNMEIKNNQLTIDIPEGMEIDLENSDLAKGIVKFKKKDITYDDILQESPTNFSGLRVRNHCLNKIIAISQLINIAKYYNGDWKPDWNNQDEYKYSIVCNRDTYKVDYGWMTIFSNIYFKNKKDAQAVIDNPNFRDILDAIYKN
jgi:hypothetical protein